MRRGGEGRAARGYTLGELLLGLLVAGLALALLLAGLARLAHRHRCAQLGADLRTFAAAFEKHHAETGRWPATAEEVGAPLRDRGWFNGSPVGGSYGWSPPGAAGQPGRISLTAFHPAFPLAITQAELLELDRRIDDGDLATGRFRTGFNGWPVYFTGNQP